MGYLDDEGRHDRILPIGGPGDAVTPRQQGERLFALLSREPRFRRVPVALLEAIVPVLSTLGKALPSLAEGRTRAHRALLRDRVDAHA